MKKHSRTEDLAILQNEKSDICISIIFLLQHNFSDQPTTHVASENCIRTAQKRLLERI